MRPEEEVDEQAATIARTLHTMNFTTMTQLILKKAGLTELPGAIGQCVHITKLEISLNPKLCSLPSAMQSLQSLRICFAMGCSFQVIPEVIGTLGSLYMLSFKSNKLEHIEALAPSIEWLILTDNKLTRLPDKLPLGLRKMMLTNNRLQSLPPAILACKDLELIRLADNQLASLPEGFLSMPKLSWLALAGNPIVERATPLPPPRWIAAEDLDIQDMVGCGGGGFVHRATWKHEPGKHAVAVKIFRGSGTVTDGDPRHEIDLGSALQHPNVIQVIGALAEPKLGLVLELLDTSTKWKELGKPPDFDTCTRDTYVNGTSFTIDGTRRTLRGVAAACAHLHAKKFTHGDLYAHNTLVDAADGEAKVGDFGAAFNYEPIEGTAPAGSIERFEVRAFACMAEEMQERIADAESAEAVSFCSGVSRLVERCMAAEVQARPLFAEICEELAKL